MAIPIPSRLIEFLMLGPRDDRRQLQDSPILGDVWVEFGKTPSRALDLLILPYKGVHAGKLAAEIRDRVEDEPAFDVQFLRFPGAKSAAKSGWDELADWSKIIIATMGRSVFAKVFDDRGALAASLEVENSDAKAELRRLASEVAPTAAAKKRALGFVESLPGASILREDHYSIAHLQGLVVARLRFEQVLRIIVPTTKWWIDKWDHPADSDDAESLHRLKAYADHGDLPERIEVVRDAAQRWNGEVESRRTLDLSPLDRLAAMTGLILWAADHHRPGGPRPGELPEDQIAYILEALDPATLARRFTAIIKTMAAAARGSRGAEPLSYQVSLNRAAMPAIARSVPSVKADAAKTLFNVSCRDIVWAVIDGGVDATHPAFRLPPYKADKDGNVPSRVRRAFDFRNFRRIVSLGNATPAVCERNLDVLLDPANQLLEARPPKTLSREKAREHLMALAEFAKIGGPIHWDLVEKFIELVPGARPFGNHGTHVAGIIGASGKAAEETMRAATNGRADAFASGLCPDITIYDFRVLGADLRDTEFAIIAALQFLRHLNSRDQFLTVHGANLSLSIPHDVRNYACGRTPICDECERLVESGVVVVAAAGNHGYQSFQTRDGSYDGYAAFSITDPGNADGVVTVGSTHRFQPHTYGVSFFSSRGPTGDGRMKPDLVAPGERVRAPVPGGRDDFGGAWEELDGTSMAAPHVSGAAAMLMARYTELIGQPRHLKRVLLESATDLGREPSFQGRGMLDVLRAFQSI